MSMSDTLITYQFKGALVEDDIAIWTSTRSPFGCQQAEFTIITEVETAVAYVNMLLFL